jgi:hypothetical protein
VGGAVRFAIAAVLLAVVVYTGIAGVAVCAGVSIAGVKQHPTVRLESHGFVDVPPARGFDRLCFWRD